MPSKVYFINPFDLLHFDCLLRLDDLAAQQHKEYTAQKRRKGDLWPGSWPKTIGVWYWTENFQCLSGPGTSSHFPKKKVRIFPVLERFYHAIPVVKAMEKCSSLVLVKAHSSPTNSDSHSDPQHSTANTPNFRAVDGVCATPVALLHSSARESPLHDPRHAQVE